MKICFLSKYPPIEGQVSTITYWLAYGLAKRGHEIIVVTNASEVEQAGRLYFRNCETGWLEPQFPAPGGRVRLFTTPPTDPKQYYIPWANPFVTKLVAQGLKAVRDCIPDLIFSYYLEPYAIAGHLLASWTGRPHIVTHAGSDIGRLCSYPDMREVYAEIVARAKQFIARNTLARQLLGERQ